MLNSAQLTALRAATTATMDLSGISVKRATRTPTNTGGYTQTQTTVASGLVGGWTQPSAGIMQQYAGVIAGLASWVVRLPYGTSVRRGDTLVMPSGDTLLVQADLSERSYPLCVRVLATELR